MNMGHPRSKKSGVLGISPQRRFLNDSEIENLVKWRTEEMERCR